MKKLFKLTKIILAHILLAAIYLIIFVVSIIFLPITLIIFSVFILERYPKVIIIF
jgi:hypothetical protein